MWFFSTLWSLIVSLDVSCRHIKIEWTFFLDQLIHLWNTTIPYFLSVILMSMWLCVLVIIRKDHMVKINYKSFIFYLSLVFHLHPALADCVNFVSMACTRDFQKVQRSFKGTCISYLLLLLLSPWFWITWLKLGFDIHHWIIFLP